MLASPTSPYRNWAPPAAHGVYSLFPNTDTLYQPSARYHPTLTHPKESLFALTSPSLFHSPVVQPPPPQQSPISPGGGLAQLELMTSKRFDADHGVKRRWDGGDVPVKTEGRSCGCRHSPSPSRLILPRTEALAAYDGGKKNDSGCSRTNPVTLRTSASSAASHGHLLVGDLSLVIKKEPGAVGGCVTPCQVPEVTTSAGVKIEDAGRKDSVAIPVGIAVARQRESKVQDVQQPISTMALVQTQDERLTNGMTPWGSSSTNHTTATTALTPPTSTLWQYPALGVEPMAPVGYQLIRDPMTGHFLLIPAASVLWPTYQQPQPDPPVQAYERLLVQAQPPQQQQQQQQQLRPSLEVKARVKEEKPPDPPPPQQHFLMRPEPLPLSLDTGKRSQATSPVSCASPPHDLIIATSQSECEDIPLALVAPPPAVTVQDASNQTDAPSPCDGDALDSITSSDELDSKPYVDDIITEASIPVAVSPVAEISVDVSVEDNNNVSEVCESKPVPAEVDLSGLELLSNSIEQFESHRAMQEVTQDDTEISEEKAAETLQLLSRRRSSSVKEPPMMGGLGLLCALAEQRFMEEVAPKTDLGDVNRNYKTRKSESDCRRFIASKVQQYYGGTSGPNSPVAFCVSPPPGDMDAMELSMRMRLVELQRKYREKQKELSRLTPKKTDSESSSPTKRGPGRPRKKCGKFSLESPPESPKGKSQRPPVLEKVTDTRWPATEQTSSKLNILKPPTLTANRILTSAKLKLETNGKKAAGVAKPADGAKVKEGDKTEKLKMKTECPDKKSAFPCSRANHTFGSKPPARLPRPGENESMFWFKSSPPTSCSDAPKPGDSPPALSPSLPLFSSSKKRKVGRPKKHLSSSPSVATETIVAKKPKSKSSLVGFLLSKSRRLSSADVPSAFSRSNSHSSYSDSFASGPGEGGALFTANGAEKKPEEVKPNKILPKLKAEAKVKTWTCGDEDDVIDWTHAKKEEKTTPKAVSPLKRKSTVISTKTDTPPCKPKVAKKSPSVVATASPPTKPPAMATVTASPPAVVNKPPKVNGVVGEPKKRGKRSESFSADQSPGTSESDDVPLIVYSKKSGSRCLLTEQMLDTERLRALALMNGLFYAGELSPIQPPDVYGIKLDGERGNKPHILTREEVLKDAIAEVRPGSLSDLPAGTRVCAYWSQQYRALYPGTVAPAPAGDAHAALVSVEFDDGDNGRMGVEDIRLLPDDYPIVEYDPNPLLTLGRRRRQASGASCESHSRRASADVKPPAAPAVPVPPVQEPQPVGEQEDQDEGDERANKEQRKRLKKRRRDKLKRLNALPTDGGKRRKKKHRCCDEHCRHRRHHRRHRKHKHRHSRAAKDSDKVESDAVSRLSPVLEQLDILEIQQTAIRQLTNENKLKEEQRKKEESVEEEPTPAATSPKKAKKESAKKRDRQASTESRSKMAAFLPARQLWGWSGRGFKRPGARGRGKKEFFKSIQRGKETIMVGDCAVFLSTGRPDRPYIGRIESMWESWGTNMVVRVKWFYHPEETTGCPPKLKYPGALFESPHVDENDVQTISHKCEVMELDSYASRMSSQPGRLAAVYDNNDVYYQAGYYDPTTASLTVVKGVV